MNIGRYEVVRDLKAGGMASAMLARAPDGRLVVLKRPHDTDPQVFARLRDEARVGARVVHPNLVETLDLFEHNGRPVLVVGFVRGLSVNDLRKGGPLPTGCVARIGWQMASCLHALHEARDENGTKFNVIHRDVSGGNILVDVAGDARLIDLGIAKFDEGRSAHTATGQVIGTLRYMAPELLDGRAASPASDLWALGCVLIEAATGEAVFPGATREVLARVMRFKSIDELKLDHVDGRLRALLGQLLRVDPTQRITAPELERALRELELAGGDAGADLADLVTRQTVSIEVDTRLAAVEGQATEPLTRPMAAVGITPGPAARTVTTPASPRTHAPGRNPSMVFAAGVAVTLIAIAFVAGGLQLKRARRQAREAARADAGPRSAPAGAPAIATAEDAGARVEDAGTPGPPRLAAVRLKDGCGAPPKLEPFFDNGDGTFQSEEGFGSNGIIEVAFACPVSRVRATVFDAHGDGHRMEAYDANGRLLSAARLDAPAPGAQSVPQDLAVDAPGKIAKVYLVPAKGDHVWYTLSDVAERPTPGVSDAEPGARLPPGVREELERALDVIQSCDLRCARTGREAIARGAKPPLRLIKACADECAAAAR